MKLSKRGWIILWTAWLLFFVASFAVFETWAMSTGGTSLSLFTWQISQAWPPLIWLLGVVAGGLAVHFWWHWSPPNDGSLGGTGG